jgi:LCP family protein required for cell wall assembly
VASTEAPSSSPDVWSRSQATVFRRGATMLAMSLVVPGSAQVAAGNRRIGRAGMRVWIALVVAGLVALVALFLARNVLLGVLTTGWVLWLGSWVVLAMGLFWSFLILNAWWAARPRDMGVLRAGILGGIALVLAGTVASGTVFLSSALRSSGSAFTTVLAGGGDTKVKAGRYNILLIGSDAGNDRTGTRTDSISIASVDAQTGRTVLFGLPRNLEDVPFIDSSPLKKLYPNGYSCPTHECLLNAVYTLAWNNKGLYPGVKDPGVQALKESVEAITGLEINYYAMVDMYGFKDLIDALGGVHMDINIAVPVGGDTSSAKSWIQPGPDRTLTGAEALWFARERKESTDYARMQRQKCVMSAMLHQMDPLTVATKFGQIAAASGQVLVTDVPSGEVSTLADLALKARSLDIANVSFAPPLIAPGSPNFDLIRSTVSEKVTASEALDKAAGKSTAKASSTASAAASKATTSTNPTAAKRPTVEETVTTTTDDLTSVCAAR